MASAESRWQELQGQYAAMSDAEVLHLFERKDDLTDVARDAIAAEFGKRGLVAVSESSTQAVLASADDADAETDEPGDRDEVPLWNFTDVTDAATSLALLQKYEVSARLRPVSLVTGRTQMDGNGRFLMQLFVSIPDMERAVDLLRRHRGLFPLGEVQDLQADDEAEGEDLFVVGEFDDAGDAALACRSLAGAQVPFRQKQEQLGEQTITVIEVAQGNVDRAGEAMQHAFRSSGVEEAEA